MQKHTPPTADLDAVRDMGWESYPYGCVGILRRNEAGGKVLWSWLVMIPWAKDGGKPWIDGTELVDPPLATEQAEREKVQLKIRQILDSRYGATVGEAAVDDFLKKLQEG